MPTFTELAEVPVDSARALVHEEGWQSWSPTAVYPVAQEPLRSTDPAFWTMNYKDPGGRHGGFAGEGLLALDPGTGAGVRVWAAADPTREVPEIRAALRGDRLVVSADGPVVDSAFPGGLPEALGAWAAAYAGGVGPLRPAPTVWCSWYQYFTAVTEADIVENLDAMDRLELPVDVVQLDDGYQAEVGDWLELSDRFASLPELVRRIRDRGRRAGLWVAPFLVGERSRLAKDHPDWLVGGADAGRNWDQDLAALDTTHPAAAAWLGEVFGTFAVMGFDYFKIDFVYAAAMAGRRHDPEVTPVQAYRRGVELVRAAIGESYLLGCGAPVLPSIGLVDAMRVSPDTAPHYEPEGGDLSRPSQRAAVLNGVSRAYQQGRFWVNDPDCLIVRPEVEQREEWAAHVLRYGGLRGSSDRLAALDAWGLEVTRQALGTVPPPVPFPADRLAGG
jgi:alpha-galactosidase